MKFRFPEQRKGEKVEFVIRKHWVIHLLAVLRFSVVGLVPVALLIALCIHFLEQGSAACSLIYSFTLLYLIFALEYSYITWTNDELDLIVVTNERVIDITQISFLHRDNSEARLEQIQDVNGDIKGIVGTLFNYGTINIRTANDVSSFDLDTVPNPVISASKILDYVKRGVYEHNVTIEIKSVRERIKEAFKRFLHQK